MNKSLTTAAFASALLLCGIAHAEEGASAPAVTSASFPLRNGVMLRSADGRRLGFVDKVEAGRDGNPLFAQVILEQRIVRVPVATINSVDKSHFTTSLNYKDATRR